MKIAFTTSDQKHINAHFGWAKMIDIYEVDENGYEFIETRNFDGDLRQDGNDDKILPKLESLLDCTIVYVTAIGGTAAAKLIKKGITPVKAKSEADEINVVLEKLVKTLKGSPPPWLRKVLQKDKKFTDDFEE